MRKLGVATLILCGLVSLVSTIDIVVETFLDFTKDTSSTSYYGIAVAGLMANLSFAYGRVTTVGDAVQARAAQAGRDFFIATILFLIAATTKFSFFHDKGPQVVVSAGCFLVGALWAYVGLFRIILALLPWTPER